MNITDPIADMLTRIRNGLVAKQDAIEVPASNMKKAIAEILLEEGYVKGISKPGLRVYAKKDQVPKVLGGLGIAIISTSRGIMTDRNARTAAVGGEVLAFVW